MGGGGKKHHQAFTIAAPTATATAPAGTTADNTPASIDVPDDVEVLAAAAGFNHVETMSPKALAHWMHPATDPAIKAALQAKADERHNTANPIEIDPASGAVIEAPDDEDTPVGMWEATPAQVLEAHTAFLEAYAQYKPTDGTTLPALIDAENHLALAHCPEISEQLAAAVESARVTIDTHPPQPFAAWTTVDNGISDAVVDLDVKELLNSDDALKLMRHSTPAETRAELVALTDKRRSESEQLDEARTALLAELNGSHFDPVNLDYLPPTASAAADYFAAHDAVTEWSNGPRMHPAANPKYLPVSPDGFATEFRQWAKKQPMPGLRATAVDMGLEPAAATTAKRTQLQNWVISTWHPKMDSNEIAASIVAPPTTAPAPAAAPISPTPTPPTPAPPAPVSKPSPSASATPSSVTAGSGRWHAKQQQLVAALKHHSAAQGDLPTRPDPALVKNWSFTAGPAMSLGGAHTKSVHTAPDGSTWMFKPDKLGGARAAAEAGANSVLHRVGIPTVGVYEHSMGNSAGTVQPLMSGASTLSSNPSTWSQADVDSIVRYHVAAWVVGDHDAKHDNLLRTPNGGLVPIDHGQAFKFYGQDKLSTSYHPNSSYGAAPPVWNVAYNAAKAGKLAPGVKIRPEAAAGVIKTFEQLPNTEFQSLLYKTAHQGAANHAIHWRSTMANTAGPSAGSSEIATAFLNHATERKTSLRTKFAMFFATEGIAGADTLTKVN